MKHKLVANKWRTPDGTVLWSKTTHDYVSYTDKNGEMYVVDGGNSYCRTTVNEEPMIDECVYADEDFEKVRISATRGTFDTDFNRLWLPIARMSDKHLCNCIIDSIENQEKDYYNVNTHLYVKELLYRNEKNLSIEDHEYSKDEMNFNDYKVLEKYDSSQYVCTDTIDNIVSNIEKYINNEKDGYHCMITSVKKLNEILEENSSN